MFQAARRLILAALPLEIAADPTERRVALFVRTYRNDLDEAFFASVAADLRSQTSAQKV